VRTSSILCRHFLRVCAAQGNRLVQDLSPAAQELLLNYSWPGNIRELQNEVQRIAVLWSSRIIEPEAFSEPASTRAGSPSPVLGGRHSLAAVERGAHPASVLAAEAGAWARRLAGPRHHGVDVVAQAPALPVCDAQ
jgi:DNA-binding NtrC family response regulator